MKPYWITFAVFGFLSVALGAFGAHGLQNILSEKYFKIFQTGVTYQFYHTLALGIVLIAYQQFQFETLIWSMRFFILGNVIFCGSLYALSLTEISILGAITPIGGLCYLIGWGVFGFTAWKNF